MKEPKNELKRRIGRFKATREMLMSNGPQCHLVFSQVTPLNINWDYDGNATIVGLSDLFEELSIALVPLDYAITFQQNGDQTEVIARRVYL